MRRDVDSTHLFVSGRAKVAEALGAAFKRNVATMNCNGKKTCKSDLHLDVCPKTPKA